ncbi:hypothetical protein F511_46832 [Dorcoceras hygrometricum]|uniref:Uncharacterized protein n=1 Tax=Dorcoceras hygrometricum TaxID=472368 RepID=A0A2Z6ZZA1_9LAMI|nr:hypothetical protein F511_46832 [Dorcoceras hygrometricum]
MRPPLAQTLRSVAPLVARRSLLGGRCSMHGGALLEEGLREEAAGRAIEEAQHAQMVARLCVLIGDVRAAAARNFSSWWRRRRPVGAPAKLRRCRDG